MSVLPKGSGDRASLPHAGPDPVERSAALPGLRHGELERKRERLTVPGDESTLPRLCCVSRDHTPSLSVSRCLSFHVCLSMCVSVHLAACPCLFLCVSLHVHLCGPVCESVTVWLCDVSLS